MNDYDVRATFEEMELELIESMKRNLSRHQKWEKKEKMNWSMWQVEQLKTLENFKKENQKIFTKKFTNVNNEIAKFIESTYKESGFDQERKILKALAKGKKAKSSTQKGLEGGFFSLNEDRMNALINATTKDMNKAEHAMLRMVNDQYRKTIYNAQIMSNSGAFTLQQSIDKATKDFLKAGINCIEYKDGRRINIASYAEMAIRTANKRAMLVSEGEVRKNYGITTVRISKYGQCSETCLPWQGRIYVDDVYSGGTKEEAQEKKLPLLSTAIDGGLFHPNCKHRSTTYFYDLKKSQGKLKDDGIEDPIEEQEHRKNKKHIQQQKRLEIGSLDSQNITQAKENKEKWIKKDEKLIKEYDSNQNNDKMNLEKEKYISKYSDSKKIDEAITYAKDILGLDYVEYDKFHIDVANMVNKEISKIYDAFENLHEKGYLNRIMIYPKQTEAYAAYFNKMGIVYMKNVKSKSTLKKMKKNAQKQFDIGFWSTNDTEHAIRHELGHAIQHLYTDNNEKKLEKISFLREGIKKRHGIDTWSMDEDLAIIKKAGKDISYYALYNDGEFIAESVAEYMCGNPRTVAKKVIEILLGDD